MCKAGSASERPDGPHDAATDAKSGSIATAIRVRLVMSFSS
jgi:hypothetical protein